MVVERIDVVAADRHCLLLRHQALDWVVLHHLPEAVVSLPRHAIDRFHLRNLLLQCLVFIFEMLLIYLELPQNVAKFIKFLVQLRLLLLHLFEFKVLARFGCIGPVAARMACVAVDRLAFLVLAEGFHHLLQVLNMVHILLDRLPALDHFFLQVLVLEVQLVDQLLHELDVQRLNLVLVARFVEHAHHGGQDERPQSGYSLLHVSLVLLQCLHFLAVLVLFEGLLVLNCGVVFVE